MNKKQRKRKLNEARLRQKLIKEARAGLLESHIESYQSSQRATEPQYSGLYGALKKLAVAAGVYVAATLGLGCAVIPAYDSATDAALLRFENAGRINDRLRGCGRVDLKAASDDPYNLENLFMRGILETPLSNGVDIAATCVAVSGDDIVRLGLAYGRKHGANSFARYRVLLPLTDGDTTRLEVLLVYNGDRGGGSLQIFYHPEDDTMHVGLTGLLGRGRVKGFAQLVADGPLDDLECGVKTGVQFLGK